MIRRIFIGVLCIISLCIATFAFGTPEAKETMSLVFSKIFGDITILSAMTIIAGVSIFFFATTIWLKRESEEEILDDSNYPIIVNLSFLFGASALIELMIIILMINAGIGIPDFFNSILAYIVIFLFLLYLTHKKMYKEVPPLQFLFFQDSLSKKKRIVPEGFQLTSFLESQKDVLDISSNIEFDIEEDYQTTTKGALIKTKTSVIYTLYLGDENTSIVHKTKEAIKFMIKKKTLSKAVVALIKKVQKDFYTNNTLKKGLTAESEEIFDHEEFKKFEDDIPVKFAEVSVYDAQTDDATLAQDREIRNAQNFRQIIRTLMTGKHGMAKEKAEEIAPYLADFKWEKTVDENTYRVIVEGLPEDLGKLITPQTIAAIGAVVGRGRRKSNKNSPTKKTT